MDITFLGLQMLMSSKKNASFVLLGFIFVFKTKISCGQVDMPFVKAA